MKKTNMKRIIITIISVLTGILAVSALTLAVLTFLWPVKLIHTDSRYELGTPVNKELAYYVDCFSWAADFCTLDFSAVDESTPGTYPITLTHIFQTEVFHVTIEDTTAPELNLTEGEIYLKAGDSYPVEYFVSSYSDLSNQVELSLAPSAYAKDYSQSARFNICGNYELQIKAEDPSGNTRILPLTVTVDSAPAIGGFKDLYVAKDYEVNYLENIYAVDSEDGDVTASLTVNHTGVASDTAGTYEVLYTATDSHGLSTTVSMPIRIMEREALQELINLRKINRFDDIIVGAYNLYDGGIYEESDVEQIMEAFHPAFVQLNYPHKSQGSGFIIKITDTDIIICTNKHVVNRGNEPEVYFYDGTCVSGTVAGKMSGVDVAFVSVPISSLEEDLFNRLVTVHINESYVNSIETPSEVSVCFRTINKDGTVWRDRTGKLTHVETALPELFRTNYPGYYKNVATATEVSAKLYAGCSGSAILDSHGNLLGIASCHFYDRSTGERHDYGMTLDNILSSYQEIFGEEVNYY